MTQSEFPPLQNWIIIFFFLSLQILFYSIHFMKKYQLGEFEELVLLTVGILHGNAYGVTIKDEIEGRLGREVSVGALQVTLRRLEKKGYLKSKLGETEKSRGGRPKLYFTITAYGKKALDYIRETRNELWKALPQTVLKLG
jgi:DNA-binding PadR family transcriptional regulator